MQSQLMTPGGSAPATEPLRFAFKECLGTGSFGEVYRAFVNRGSGAPREVAVKVLKLERRDQREAVGRLKDEARMLAALDHPAILRFEEFTRVEGRIALVTEYVEGVDLVRFTDPEHRMPPRVALEVMATVASALQCAMRTPSPETGNPLGLIHRDIKPHNIRISTRGEVKLLDFGIARTTELARDVNTMLGDVVCTPGYAAPEVLCGDAPGPEADVYSLAITLYRVLCDVPFHLSGSIARQRHAVMLRTRYGAFLDERLAQLPPLPGELMELLERMLAHEPADRPTAAEVEAELLAVAADMDGPDLTEWTMDLRPLPPETHEGDLVGLATLEEVMSAVPTATPAGSTLRPPLELSRVGPEGQPAEPGDSSSTDQVLYGLMVLGLGGLAAFMGWLAFFG